MEDHLYLGAVLGQEIEQALGGNDLGDLALGDIAPFVVAAQAIDHDEFAVAPRFQRRQQVGPDEAGASGHHIHEIILVAH